MSDPVAKLTDVGKQFVKYEDVPTMLTGIRRMFSRGRRGRLWAVRHVDLEVLPGEAIGIIGRNGSGKSTTLAMLAGVTAPTEGTVRVAGRLAPLLRLGVGFEQELTGRENVYVNGMILGMSQREISERFDEIVAFAEMADFIDTPVKFYSSGMLVRLGFASAIAAEPDLLIVDEVLAVGDVGFQSKSFDRMLELRERGTTLVVVSHNMSAIRRLAERVIVLEQGEVKFEGSTDEGISVYHDLMRYAYRTARGMGTEDDPADVDVLSFELLGEDGEPTSNLRFGELATFRLRVRFRCRIEDATFGMVIQSPQALFVYGENSMGSVGPETFEEGEEATFVMRAPMRLVSGTYNATCGVRWGEVVKEQVNTEFKSFYVSGRDLVRGLVDLEGTFEIAERKPSVDRD